jgi:3-hexulose-6-phosphate synthase and related proteins
MPTSGLVSRLKTGRHLQVALDFIDLEPAVKTAKEVSRAGATVIEAGTPLVKSHGIAGIKAIKEASGSDRIILADTKTADAGDVEAEIAKRAGASIMTVLGAMDDSTIESAVSRAHESDILVQVDMINVKDVVKRAERVAELGADIIGLHVGLDVQKARKITVADMKREIEEVASLGVMVSVAGGLNAERIKELLHLPVSIFVVGGAITKSKDPYAVALEIVNILKGY